MPTMRQLIRQATAPRRRLNLGHKRHSLSKSKWYIGKRQSSQIYYLADFDEAAKTALWSKHKRDGMAFNTEVGVNQYISSNLNNRTDLMLIRVEE